MRLFNLRLVSGLSNLSDNPTPLPDERDGPSSGLSRTLSGYQLEPDDNKPLTYAGYSGYRRVCRVYGSMGATNKKWSARLLAVLFLCTAHPARVAS
jgi:hypothetical protein